MPLFSSGWNKSTALRAASAALIPDADNEYEARCSKIAVHIPDINGSEGISALSRTRADVLLSFGGPIYNSQVIASSPLALNYHTGISPFYNGTGSMYFAFANGHIRLCGGTLMKLAPRVDSGDIMAHFSPEIEASDDPATLFVKSVVGGTNLCNRFIKRAAGEFTALPQGRPVFSFRGRDWTVAQPRAISRIISHGKVAGFTGPAKISEYWCLPQSEARSFLNNNILEWTMGYA
jgi:methionyl-tRNA formyltransferase